MVESPELPQAEPEAALSDADARPLSVTAAALILLTVAIFTGLIGAVLLILVVINSNPAALPAYIDAAPDGFAGAGGAIGAALVAYGVAGALVAIQAMRRRSWARGVGIVLAAVGVAALVLALIRPSQTTGTTPLIFAPVIAALAYAAVALATEGRWYEGSVPRPDTR